MKSLKNLIINSLKKIDFKYLEIKEPDKKFLELIKEKIKRLRKENYGFLVSGIKNKDLANFIFVLRVLDFRLWEFPKNWHFKNKKGFWGLFERTKILFNYDVKNIKFEDFRKIISPKESINLAKIRYGLLKESLRWLDKNYDFDFNNYFEENKKPYYFAKNLTELKKFRDYIKDFYFFKPNQLLYYEYILARREVKKFCEEIKDLTVFADLDLFGILNYFGVLNVKNEKIFYNNIKKNSKKEIEIRGGSILACELIREKLDLDNSYEIDSALWNLAKKFKIKKLKIKSIFY
jgi:hypothetical protein